MYIPLNINTQTQINRLYGKMPCVDELPALGYKLHHTALSRGYVSRKCSSGLVVPYSGKFGEGYVVFMPRFDTSRYCTIYYYVKEDR